MTLSIAAPYYEDSYVTTKLTSPTYTIRIPDNYSAVVQVSVDSDRYVYLRGDDVAASSDFSSLPRRLFSVAMFCASGTESSYSITSVTTSEPSARYNVSFTLSSKLRLGTLAIGWRNVVIDDGLRRSAAVRHRSSMGCGCERLQHECVPGTLSAGSIPHRTSGPRLCYQRVVASTGPQFLESDQRGRLGAERRHPGGDPRAKLVVDDSEPEHVLRSESHSAAGVHRQHNSSKHGFELCQAGRTARARWVAIPCQKHACLE